MQQWKMEHKFKLGLNVQLLEVFFHIFFSPGSDLISLKRRDASLLAVQLLDSCYNINDRHLEY